jgi:hypothetical protein
VSESPAPLIVVLAKRAHPFSRPLIFDVSNRWSSSVNGVACRASQPEAIRKGDRMRVRLSFRAEPETLPPGITHLDGHRPDLRLRLVLRNPETGLTAEVLPDDPTGGMPPPPPPDGADPPDDPDRIPIASSASHDWIVWFPTSKAWDALAPGTWESHVELDAKPDPENPEGWSGRISTESASLVIDESPACRLHLLVPRELRVKRCTFNDEYLQVGCSREELEPTVVDMRNGFVLGAWVKEGEDIHETNETGPYWSKDFSLLERHTVRFDGPIPAIPFDRTIVLEVFETAEQPVHMSQPGPGRGSFRVLWSRSYRVQATAAEIEALRR